MAYQECVLPMMTPKTFFHGLLRVPLFHSTHQQRWNSVPIVCDFVGRLQRISIPEDIYPLMNFKKKEKQKYKPSYMRSIASCSYRYKNI